MPNSLLDNIIIKSIIRNGHKIKNLRKERKIMKNIAETRRARREKRKEKRERREEKQRQEDKRKRGWRIKFLGHRLSGLAKSAVPFLRFW